MRPAAYKKFTSFLFRATGCGATKLTKHNSDRSEQRGLTRLSRNSHLLNRIARKRNTTPWNAIAETGTKRLQQTNYNRELSVFAFLCLLPASLPIASVRACVRAYKHTFQNTPSFVAASCMTATTASCSSRQSVVVGAKTTTTTRAISVGNRCCCCLP
jgi:hypothetical protein